MIDQLAEYSSAKANREETYSGQISDLTAALEQGTITNDAFKLRIVRMLLAEHALAFRANKKAETDPLTQLPNRRAFLEELTNSRTWADKQGIYMGLILVDIDHFKAFNDANNSHAIGDEVLVGFAEVLKQRSKTGEVVGVMRQASSTSGIIEKRKDVARLGGEEFVLTISTLASDINPGGTIFAEAEFLRKQIEETTLKLSNGKEANLTISLGVTLARPGEANETVLSHADTALYEAKRNGRNQTKFFLG